MIALSNSILPVRVSGGFIWQWWLLFLLLIIYLFLIVFNCFLVFYLCEQQMWKNKAAGGTFLLTSSLNPPWKWSVFQKVLWGLRTECLLSWERSPVIQGRLHLSSMPSALRIVCCLFYLVCNMFATCISEQAWEESWRPVDHMRLSYSHFDIFFIHIVSLHLYNFHIELFILWVKYHMMNRQPL